MRPRIKRDWKYALVRAFATVIQLDLQVAAVTADVLAGRPVIYTTFLAYDEVAHHSGLERPDTLAVLRRVDLAIERIAAAAEHGAAARTSSSCSPTTARARARRSASATAKGSRTSSSATAAARSAPRTAHTDEGLASFNASVAEVASRDTRDGPRRAHGGRQAARRARGPTASRTSR